ncbi:hypothetical protein BH23BAC1_BH23BAC1_45750 [soil metagenome]
MALRNSYIEKEVSKISEKRENTIRQNFPVLGMTCAACAVSVESMLKSTEGVVDAGVNFANQTAWAEYDASLKPQLLKKAIQDIGYDLIIELKIPRKYRKKHSVNILKN